MHQDQHQHPSHHIQSSQNIIHKRPHNMRAIHTLTHRHVYTSTYTPIHPIPPSLSLSLSLTHTHIYTDTLRFVDDTYDSTLYPENVSSDEEPVSPDPARSNKTAKAKVGGGCVYGWVGVRVYGWMCGHIYVLYIYMCVCVLVMIYPWHWSPSPTLTRTSP